MKTGYNGGMNEGIKRVYVDTSVVYGAPTKELSLDTKRFWTAVRNGKVIIIVSDVLDEELKRSPEHVRSLHARVPESQIERVMSTKESNGLAAQYIAEKVVGETNLDDCRHIALATLAHADALVSWNFGHIVYRRAGYNDVNEKMGYPKIEIQSPKTFMENYHDNT
jgi:predicted nucleic acid-binding protein